MLAKEKNRHFIGENYFLKFQVKKNINFLSSMGFLITKQKEKMYKRQ